MGSFHLNRRTLNLVYSHVANWTQMIKRGSAYSSSKHSSIRISQGSVLGPLLFNIFITDFLFMKLELEVCNFADDITIYASDTTIDALMEPRSNDPRFCPTFIQQMLVRNSNRLVKWSNNYWPKIFHTWDNMGTALITKNFKWASHDPAWFNKL